MKKSTLTLYCGLLFCVTAASIDIMLPVFHQMAGGLNTSLEGVQYSIPVFLLPFALMQMVYGPASDRFGRKPVLQIGLSLYALGSVLVFLAPSLSIVLAGRFLQGLGAASGQVIARAILRDENSGKALAQAIGLAMAIFSVAPIFAPLIGYFIGAISNWRGVFVFLFAFGIFLWCVTRFFYQETNRNLDENALQVGSILNAISAVLANQQSRYFLLVAVILHSTIILYVTNVAPLLEEAFEIRDLNFALIFAFTGLGIPVGQYFNHRAVEKFGIEKTMKFASFFTLLCLATLLLLNQFGALTLLGFAILMFLYSASFLTVLGNATSKVIEPHPEIAGLASAFYGTSTLLGSALSTGIFISIIDKNMQIWALVMLGYAGISFCLLWFAIKKLSMS